MLLLSTTTQSLEVVLGGAASTQPPWMCVYVELIGAASSFSGVNGTTNSTTPVTIVSTPAAGRQRRIKTLTLHNADAAAQTVTLRVNDNATLRTVWTTILQPGDSLQYVHGKGFQVTSALGYIKQTEAGKSHRGDHQHGGADEIATATPTANAIPKATSGGKLDGWISAAAASTKGLVELDTDLGGTALIPTVAGLRGSALPANAAGKFFKRNAANNAWEAVGFGAAANTVMQGNDPGFPALERDIRLYRPMLTPSGTITLVSGKAYFVYLGVCAAYCTIVYVKFFQTTAGTGAVTEEIGLFSSANPPNKSAQTLTKLVSTATISGAGANVIRNNTSTFAGTPIYGGTHLWAGLRTAYATSQPQVAGVIADLGHGFATETSGAGALTGSGPWTGSIIAFATSATAPFMVATLDA